MYPKLPKCTASKFRAPEGKSPAGIKRSGQRHHRAVTRGHEDYSSQMQEDASETIWSWTQCSHRLIFSQDGEAHGQCSHRMVLREGKQTARANLYPGRQNDFQTPMTGVQRNHGRTRSEATPLFPLLAATRCLKAERVYLSSPKKLTSCQPRCGWVED